MKYIINTLPSSLREGQENRRLFLFLCRVFFIDQLSIVTLAIIILTSPPNTVPGMLSERIFIHLAELKPSPDLQIRGNFLNDSHHIFS